MNGQELGLRPDGQAEGGCPRIASLYDHPSEADRYQMIRTYFQMLIEEELPDAVGKMKQFASWFTHGVPEAPTCAKKFTSQKAQSTSSLELRISSKPAYMARRLLRIRERSGNGCRDDQPASLFRHPRPLATIFPNPSSLHIRPWHLGIVREHCQATSPKSPEHNTASCFRSSVTDTDRTPCPKSDQCAPAVGIRSEM